MGGEAFHKRLHPPFFLPLSALPAGLFDLHLFTRVTNSKKISLKGSKMIGGGRKRRGRGRGRGGKGGRGIGRDSGRKGGDRTGVGNSQQWMESKRREREG